jgi:hypothetical protein
MESIKVCRNCGESKYLECYPVDKRNRDGRGGTCCDCHNSKRRVQKSPEKIKRKGETLLHNYSKLSTTMSGFLNIINALDQPEFADDDMTSKIKRISDQLFIQCKEFADEYQNILHPPKSEFILDASELLVPFDTMNPNAFIAILQSQLQIFVVLQKNDTDVSVSITHNGGVYTITLPQKIKLSNNEFTDFMRSTNYVAPVYAYNS